MAGVRRPIQRAVQLRLDVHGRVDHLPGQHYVVRLTAPDGYTAQRSYSVASAPGDPLVELFVERLDDGEYRVSARMGIDDLGELFGLDLDDEEVDTVGGLLAKALGRVPIVGSEVTIDGIGLRAERVEGRRNRVSHVIASRRPPEHIEQDERETVEADHDRR